MNRLCVIPARGGSKRIPRKNIKPFAGLPMIAHSIAAARASGLFSRIVVSTDDAEIAEIARMHGAEIPFIRPAALSNDHAGTIPVIAHAIETLAARRGPADAVCCLYATAPFVRAGDLREGLRLLESGDWSYVFTATEFPAPIFRSFRVLDSGGVEMFYPDKFATRSQDLPRAWHDAGQFYWGRPSAWLAGEPFFTPRARALLLPRWQVQDIDTQEDWERAELIAPALNARLGEVAVS